MTEFELVAGADRNEIGLASGSRQGMEDVRGVVKRGNQKIRVDIKEVRR